MVATVDPRTNPDYGPEGPHTSDGMRDLWQMARGLDANALSDEQRARGERYIPIDAIEVRYDILPRSEQTADRETVDRYLDVFDQLPPITLQSGTLILIDGLHRLEAAYRMEGRYHIRAVLRDVADADLYIEAGKANLAHGRPLTPGERRALAERIVRDPLRGDWSDAAVARLVGMNRHTIDAMRKKTAPRATETASATNPVSKTATYIAPEQPALALGDEPDEPPMPRSTTPPAAPAPRPAAPLADADVKQLMFDFGRARSLFDDYNPEYIATRYKASGVPKLVRELETWRSWIDEALTAARGRLGGGA